MCLIKQKKRTKLAFIYLLELSMETDTSPNRLSQTSFKDPVPYYFAIKFLMSWGSLAVWRPYFTTTWNFVCVAVRTLELYLATEIFQAYLQS
jgi:hypothetical protein